MWQGNKPTPYLPGQFFFKGSGPIVAVGTNDASTAPIIPTDTDQYLLGGYGSIRTKGRDVLGPEQQILFTTRSDAGGGDWLAIAGSPGAGEQPMIDDPEHPGNGNGSGNSTTGTRKIWPWTRSRNSTSIYDGSPFSASQAGDSNDQLEYGNPNGIRDGIVLVLTAGEDNRSL